MHFFAVSEAVRRSFWGTLGQFWRPVEALLAGPLTSIEAVLSG